MKLEGITLEFSGGLTIRLWPQWGRVAILSPFGESQTLSLSQFQLAIANEIERRKKKIKTNKRGSANE